MRGRYIGAVHVKKGGVATTQGRQDSSDSRFEFLNVFNSDEIRRALIEKRGPIPVILIEVRNVDVFGKNKFLNGTKNSEPISLVEHHDECSLSDEVVSNAFKRIAGPVVGNGLVAIRVQHVAFGKGQSIGDGFSSSQMFIELPHHHGRKRIVDLPECRNNAACSGEKESTRQISNTLGALESPGRSLAR